MKPLLFLPSPREHTMSMKCKICLKTAQYCFSDVNAGYEPFCYDHLLRAIEKLDN